MGETVPLQRLADWTGRTRRRIEQVMRQLERDGLVVEGQVDSDAWKRWAETDHYDRLPSCLLGKLGEDLSPGLLAACALLFSEAQRDRRYVRADRERAELLGLGRATVAKAHELLEQRGLVRRERRMVLLSKGRKRLHVVRPPSEPIRCAYGLGKQRATLQAWALAARHGKQGAAMGGSRFLTPQDAAQCGDRRAAKCGDHLPYLPTVGLPHTSSDDSMVGRACEERMEAEAKDGHRDAIQALVSKVADNDRALRAREIPRREIVRPLTICRGHRDAIQALVSKVADNDRALRAREIPRRERIQRIDLRRQRDPVQQIEHVLAESGLWLIEGKRPNPKLEARRWALARELDDAGATPEEVLEVAQNAARDPKVKAVSRVLDFRLRRLADRSRARPMADTADRSPARPTDQLSESPAMASARRRMLSNAVGAAMAGDWSALAKTIEHARRTDLIVTVEQIAAKSGLADAVIVTGLSTVERVSEAG